MACLWELFVGHNSLAMVTNILIINNKYQIKSLVEPLAAMEMSPV